MNRTKSIAVFAAIFAVAMTTYGLSGASASPMAVASIPQTYEGMGMLGHVEYTVLDADNTVKAYLQSDNLVTRGGTDCVAEQVFTGAAGSTSCADADATFRYIAIANGTAGADDTDQDLEEATGVACGAGNTGEQARKLVVPTQTDDGDGLGTVVVLDVGTDTFKFDAGNATTITMSGLFNADVGTTAADGSCSTLGTAFEMFAIQDLPSPVTVSAGDSLAVKWTITIN